MVKRMIFSVITYDSCGICSSSNIKSTDLLIASSYDEILLRFSSAV